jgi:hypothetical protein
MINITDLLLIICSILFIYIGINRGFLRSLMGPIAFILGSLLGLICFEMTKNLMWSFCVGALSPILITWGLSGLLNLWYPREDWVPNALSQILGAVLTLLWGMPFILAFVVIASILPPANPVLKAINEDVNRSYCFKQIKPLINQFLPEPKKTNPSPGKTPSPSEIQALAEDPRFKAIREDPEIQKQIEANNFGALMANPKMMALTQEVMKDPELMKKLLRASQTPSK